MPHTAHTNQLKIDFNAGGDNTVITANASGVIKVYAITFTVSAATQLIYKSAATALTGAFRLTGDGSSMTLPLRDEPWYTCNPGEAFIMNSANAVSFGGSIWWTY